MGAGRPEAVPVGSELHIVAFAVGADVTGEDEPHHNDCIGFHVVLIGRRK